MKHVTIEQGSREDRYAAGYYPIRKAAELLGISYGRLKHHVYRRNVPEPSVKVNGGTRLHYTDADMAVLKKFFSGRKMYEKVR